MASSSKPIGNRDWWFLALVVLKQLLVKTIVLQNIDGRGTDVVEEKNCEGAGSNPSCGVSWKLATSNAQHRLNQSRR